MRADMSQLNHPPEALEMIEFLLDVCNRKRGNLVTAFGARVGEVKMSR